MPDAPPSVIVLAGANGSGKTTSAPKLLRDVLGVVEFVNADTIAQGLAAFSPELVALEAGAIMLSRLHRLAEQRRTFAFETTLAGRSLATWLAQLVASGYDFHLIYLWLPSPDLAVARVADRVRNGGHDVPEDTIRRRYHAGLKNFFRLYRPLATVWRMYDNSNADDMRLIAEGEKTTVARVVERSAWQAIIESIPYGQRE
jgi:predicted ABC-type ATPase